MMDFLNLDESLHTAIRISKAIAREYGNAVYTPSHLLRSLLHKDVGISALVESLGKDVAYLTEWADVHIESCEKLSGVSDIEADPRIAPVFEEADNVRLKLGLLQINPICVLCALAKPEIGYSSDQLKSFPIREKEILDFFLTGGDMQRQVLQKMNMEGDAADMPLPQTNLLKYCIDKTAEAREGKLHAIV